MSASLLKEEEQCPFLGEKGSSSSSFLLSCVLPDSLQPLLKPETSHHHQASYFNYANTVVFSTSFSFCDWLVE